MSRPSVGAPDVVLAQRDGVGLDGRPRPSEDRVVVLPNAVLLLDGATAMRPTDQSGGWYAEILSHALADRLRVTPDGDLGGLLGAAIADVAAEYHLVVGQAPSSTVAMVRWSATHVDALVLADSPVVAFTLGGVHVLADDRLASLPRLGGYRHRLRAGAGYGAGHVAALRASSDDIAHARNVDGGFWVAEADPAAASRARRARWSRPELPAVLLASDGVSCGVDDYRLFGWPDVLDIVNRRGAGAVLDAVRSAELADPDGIRWPRPKQHDDQALALVRF